MTTSTRLGRFNRIGLAELGAASLMRRTDTKFVFHASSLASILQKLQGSYRLLEVEGITSHDYRTLYFDTPKLELFHAHHRGSTHRFKERVDRSSPVMQRMRSLGVRPGGFSKYCMGVSLVNPGVKRNRFKPKLRALGDLMGGAPHVA